MNTSNFKAFDMAETLHTEEDIQNYLNLVKKEGDKAELTHALEIINKARQLIQTSTDTKTKRRLFKLSLLLHRL